MAFSLTSTGVLPQSRNLQRSTRAPRQSTVMAAASSRLRILGISGSLRQASYNTGMLKAAAEMMPPEVDFRLANIADLPMLNTDLEHPQAPSGQVFPSAVEAWRTEVGEADAFFFSSPEYNYGLTAALKNAIDWASRPPNQFNDKAAAVVSAGGGYAGVQSTRVLRLSGIFLNLHFINKPEMSIKFTEPGHFDKETGALISSSDRERLQQVVDALVSWTKRIQQ